MSIGDILPSGKGIPVKATAQGETNVTARAEIALHRIAEEVSRDIAEHASATHITGTLKNLPNPLIRAIPDDGHRFEPDSVPSEPVGFRIMQHRAAGAHGRGEGMAATTCLRGGASLLWYLYKCTGTKLDEWSMWSARVCGTL